MRWSARARVRTGLMVVVGSAAGALILLGTLARSPVGAFECPKVAAVGRSYLQFHDGKVILVLPGQSEYMGTYTNRFGQWIWITESSNELYLVPGLTRLRVFETNGGEVDGYSNLRRIWSFRRRS